MPSVDAPMCGPPGFNHIPSLSGTSPCWTTFGKPLPAHVGSWQAGKHWPDPSSAWKLQKRLCFVLCIVPGKAMGWSTVSCAPSSGRPSLHRIQSASGRKKMAVSGWEGCTLARQSLQHQTSNPSFLLFPSNSNFWTNSLHLTLPLIHRVTLRHARVAAGLWQRGQAKNGACGAASREVKVGEFAPLLYSWMPPCSSLQLLSGACSSAELPHHVTTLTARRTGISHHTSPPWEMQPSPGSFRYPVFILPCLTEETQLPEPEVKIIAGTKPWVVESLLSCIIIIFQEKC